MLVSVTTSNISFVCDMDLVDDRSSGTLSSEGLSLDIKFAIVSRTSILLDSCCVDSSIVFIGSFNCELNSTTRRKKNNEVDVCLSIIYTEKQKEK